MGTFSIGTWGIPIVIAAAFGVVLTAGYILWMLQRTLFGPKLPRFDGTVDAVAVDILPMALLLAAIFVIGIYPALLTDVFNMGLAPILGGVS